MRHASTRYRLTILAAAAMAPALLAAALLPATALGASQFGAITRASAQGSQGSFAGHVSYDGVGCTDPCHWRGILTVQPASTTAPLYPCDAYNWRRGGDPNVMVIWDSGDQTIIPGTASFDRDDFPILDGVQDQRVCLYLAYTSPPELENNYQCEANDPYCPPGVTQEEFLIADQTTFTVVPGGSPGPGYPRPQGASPLRASLVPAYAECTAPNRSHGAPLNFPSCYPPMQVSSYLTIGTGDANGQPANSVASVKAVVVPGNPSTTTDEADVRLTVRITDVRTKTDLADYSGELLVVMSIRITDRQNDSSGPEPGTASDINFTFPISCTPVSDGNIGSTCSTSTTADSVIADSVRELQRSIWEIAQVQVMDGGEDAAASTIEDNTLFMKQGLFVP
jgi:hypothetical protein